MWRTTHNDTKSNADRSSVTLTDTDANILGVHVNIIHTEVLIYQRQRVDYGEQDDDTCAPVCMLRRGAFGNISTKDFNGTIKNCVPRRCSKDSICSSNIIFVRCIGLSEAVDMSKPDEWFLAYADSSSSWKARLGIN